VAYTHYERKNITERQAGRGIYIIGYETSDISITIKLAATQTLTGETGKPAAPTKEAEEPATPTEGTGKPTTPTEKTKPATKTEK